MVDGPVVNLALFLLGVLSIGLCSYLGYRMNRNRPDRSRNIPVFSRDPTLISPDGIVWRRRFYIVVLILVFVWTSIGIAKAVIKENAAASRASRQQDTGLR